MTNARISKGLNIALWTLQVILALSFVWAAGMKWLAPADRLAAMWPWTADHVLLVKITGIFDLLAGLGLVLPGWLRVRPSLTIYAAYGTILLMIAASAFHLSRGEASVIGANVFFLAGAVFIAWGRRKEQCG